MSLAANVGQSDRLAKLGYAQGLQRKLHAKDVIGLALANVSPTMAVVLLTTGVFSIGGTFSIGADVILGVIVVLISMCLGELGSMYPVAGGMYSLVRYVLPAPMKWVTLFNYLIQGIILPASIALGIPQFLKDLIPAIHLSEQIIAVLAVLLAVGIALVRVELGAWITMSMVIVEFVVLTVVTLSAILHPHQSLMGVTFKPVYLSGSMLQPVSFVIMAASLAPAFNIINGYDAALGFSEELVGGAKSIAKCVIIAASVAAVSIIIPLTAAIVAAPDLHAFFDSSIPVIYSVQHALGPSARVIVDVGVCIALFNSMLAYLMYFGRVFYTTGRDNLWWNRANRGLAKLNRFRVPGLGIALLAIPTIALLFLSQLNWLIVFAGTVTTVVYLFVGIAALWSRIQSPNEARPFRMKLWPIPPIVVILFTGFALFTQEAQFLVGEAVLAGLALCSWGISKLWTRPSETTGTIDDADSDETEAIEA
jgi:amino acid transporter